MSMEIKITGKFPTLKVIAAGERTDIIIGLACALTSILDSSRKPETTNEDIVDAIAGTARNILKADRTTVDFSEVLKGGIR